MYFINGPPVFSILGSTWHPIPASADTFSATAAGGVLASAPMTPPNAPEAWTGFLLGTAGFGYTLMPMIDAPEKGACRPLPVVGDDNNRSGRSWA